MDHLVHYVLSTAFRVLAEMEQRARIRIKDSTVAAELGLQEKRVRSISMNAKAISV
jgi:hypothetical protein